MMVMFLLPPFPSLALPPTPQVFFFQKNCALKPVFKNRIRDFCNFCCFRRVVCVNVFYALVCDLFVDRFLKCPFTSLKFFACFLSKNFIWCERSF